MYCLERPSTTPDTGWTSPSTSLSRSRCCPVDRTLRRIATIDTRGRVRPRTGDLVGGLWSAGVPVGDARAVGPADRGPYYAWGKRESRAMRILGRTA